MAAGSQHTGETQVQTPEPNCSPGLGKARTSRSLSLRKKLLFAFIAVLVPLALIIAIGEIGGRIYVHFKYGVPGKSYGIYMADEELGATHRPNSYNTNSLINNFGFRDSEDITQEKPPGATRIYCSGGSTTYCYNLDTAESWPSLLQQRMRTVKGHERDEVLNAGQITFGVAQEFVLAKRMIPRLKPDIVIIFTGINELLAANIITYEDGKNLDQLLAEQQWGVCPQHPDQARFLKRHSVLVRLIDYKIKKFFENRATSTYHNSEAPPIPMHPWVSANYEHTLRDYLDFLRQQGCRVIILRYGDNGKEDWYLQKCIHALRDRAVEIGKEEGAAICDLVPVVEKDPRRKNLFIQTGVHVTKEGADLYADYISREVLALRSPAPPR